MKRTGTVAVVAAAWLLAGAAGAAEPVEGKARSVYYGTFMTEIRSLDPATCGDTTSSALQGMIFEGLYGYHYLKRPLKVIPQLAAAMPDVSADGLTWRIKIRKGVKYSRSACFGASRDGTFPTRTVRAADFVFAFKRIADFHVPSNLSWAFLDGRIVGLNDYRKRTRGYKLDDLSRYDLPVAGLRAVDETTLQLRLTRPFPRLTDILAMHLYAPIPPEAVRYCLAKTRRITFTHPMLVGTGPYVLDEFNPKSRIVFVRNGEFRADYYPSEGSPLDREAGMLADAGKRVPFIDRIKWDYVSEHSRAWKAFLAGQVDILGISRDVFKQVIGRDMKLTEAYADRGLVLVRSNYPAVYWVCFNMTDPVVGKSKSLRQAMCLSFDVEAYVKTQFNGRARRAVNCVHSGFVGHAEAGPGPYARLDVDLARKKLVAARKELVAAGAIKPGGKIPTLTLELGARDELMAERARFMIKQFAAIGLEVEVVLNDWPALQRKVNQRKAQMFTMGWHADYADAENFLQLYTTASIKTGVNTTGYSNPAFDKLFARLEVMPDSPQRREILARLIRMISEDCPILLLTEPRSYVLHHKWVRNYKPHPMAYGTEKYRRIDTANRPKRRPIQRPKPRDDF